MTVLEFIESYDKDWVRKADILILTTTGKDLFYGVDTDDGLLNVPYNLLSRKITKWRAVGYSQKRVSLTLYTVD